MSERACTSEHAQVTPDRAGRGLTGHFFLLRSLAVDSERHGALKHRAVGPLLLTLLAHVSQTQSKTAGRPQRQAGAQDRRVPRQADAVHGQPFVEAGEARVEYAAVLMQRVPPAGTAIEFHPHAVAPLPAPLGTQAQSRLETPGVTRPSHEPVAQT